jgi:hypothetical protein
MQLFWKLNSSFPYPVRWSYIVWWISTHISKDSTTNILKVQDRVNHDIQKNKEQGIQSVFSFALSSLALNIAAEGCSEMVVPMSHPRWHQSCVFWYYAMWYHVAGYTVPDFLKESMVFIYKGSAVYNYPRRWKQTFPSKHCEPYNMWCTTIFNETSILSYTAMNASKSNYFNSWELQISYDSHKHTYKKFKMYNEMSKWYGTVVYMQLHLQWYPDSPVCGNSLTSTHIQITILKDFQTENVVSYNSDKTEPVLWYYF